MAKTKGTQRQIKALRGTEDVLPQDWPLWRAIEKAAREVFELAGYYEIRTPVFEDTNLFVRGIGEVTDIVEKEMYTFNDGESAALTLRPENTASVMRAYVEHEMHKTKRFQKFYYIGPMFRKERPQAGRLRQFHQIGIEAIGATDPMLDAETIILAVQMYKRIGLDDCRVKINSIGCRECRPHYRENLKGELINNKERLCELCKIRMGKNVLRVLDCKEKGCKEIAAATPPIYDYLCESCKPGFDRLREVLSISGVDYDIDSHLVRGLDYYTKTVYEITHPSLGARDTICAGGRYDYLVADIGGPETGAVGFAAGMEASMLAIKNKMRHRSDRDGRSDESSSFIEDPASPHIYIVSIGDEVRNECFMLANTLRSEGISVDMDYEERSAKAQMRTANKVNAKMTIVIGQDEVDNGTVKLKNMKTGEENVVSRGNIASLVKL